MVVSRRVKTTPCQRVADVSSGHVQTCPDMSEMVCYNGGRGVRRHVRDVNRHVASATSVRTLKHISGGVVVRGGPFERYSSVDHQRGSDPAKVISEQSMAHWPQAPGFRLVVHPPEVLASGVLGCAAGGPKISPIGSRLRGCCVCRASNPCPTQGGGAPSEHPCVSESVAVCVRVPTPDWHARTWQARAALRACWSRGRSQDPTVGRESSWSPRYRLETPPSRPTHRLETALHRLLKPS